MNGRLEDSQVILTESRLRRIIRHVLSEAGLGTYKRKKKGALEQMRTQIHQTRGQKMGTGDDDGYDSVMGFDEADGAKLGPVGEEIKDEGDLEEGDPNMPPGCNV